MAVAPLFIASMATLKSQLRLTGAAQSDALAMIDAAVQKVRVGFYDALGVDRVSELGALGFSENPTTTNGILRLKANNTELAWVRMELMRALPMLFMDAEAAVKEVWNEEGLTRKAHQKDLSAEIERLQEEIFSALAVLEGGDVADGGINVSVIGPDGIQARPGDSIKPVMWG